MPHPVRFGPCAGVVLTVAEIRLTRQGQPEPGQGLEQFHASRALLAVLPDRARKGTSGGPNAGSC